MRLVSLSFDPDYDTPQRLAKYSEAMRDDKCDRMAVRDSEIARGFGVDPERLRSSLWISVPIRMIRKVRCIRSTGLSH